VTKRLELPAGSSLKLLALPFFTALAIGCDSSPSRIDGQGEVMDRAAPERPHARGTQIVIAGAGVDDTASMDTTQGTLAVLRELTATGSLERMGRHSVLSLTLSGMMTVD
jgi:hypothetical protein